MIDYRGTRWYKCDFHLHTNASICFTDSDNSIESFMNTVVKNGLDCIAITDHNTGKNIDDIKAIAKEKGIVVFPGVEITCSEAKVHVLVLFDVDKRKTDVEDFLISLGLNRNDFATSEAHVNMNLEDLYQRAIEENLLLIPAHIDDYSGLSNMAPVLIKEFFQNDILGVQIVHEELLKPNIQVKDNNQLLDEISKFHKEKSINYDQITQWCKCRKYIGKIANLTFSDNPLSESSSKHGLWGIGNSYSWIKMTENPNLESLRQALIMNSMRVKNCFVSKNKPYELPNIWIKDLKCENLALTDKGKKLYFDLSPQMNTVIGGRGSGKSSLVRFLRGIFKKNIDIEELYEIKKEFSNFYKKKDRKCQGVFKDKSSIVVTILKNNIVYRITVSDIESLEKQNLKIEKFDEKNEKFNLIENNEYLNLFDLEIYSQKQIYEIAQSPNILRERIDSAIDDVKELEANLIIKENEYLSNMAQIRESESKIKSKKKFEAELKEKSEQIESYKNSGIEELLNNRKKFIEDEKIVNKFEEKYRTIVNDFDSNIEEFISSISNFNENDNLHSEELEKIHKNTKGQFIEGMERVKEIKQSFDIILNNMKSSFNNSAWNKKLKNNYTEIENVKNKLDEKGVNDINNFENIIESKNSIENKLKTLIEEEQTIIENNKRKKIIYNKMLTIRKKITSKRILFLEKILKNCNVKIEVQPFRDKVYYEEKFREIINKQTEYEKPIDYLIKKCFEGEQPDKLKDIHKDLELLRTGEVPEGYDGYFKKVIQKIDDNVFDKLIILIPEDKIIANYKPANSTNFKSIENASAGQKTATILTFILAYGTSPLILDQPEDDLDNHLIYDLVVDSLKNSKEKRQIIVISHNANIPVNGDSEYIIAMNSESKNLNIVHEGTIEEEVIKNEICNVMEGGETAFKTRLRRYKF